MDRQTGTQGIMEFAWQRQPEAETLVKEWVTDFLEKCPDVKRLADRMRKETGTRFVDWIDHIGRQNTDGWADRLLHAGYIEDNTTSGLRRFIQPHGMFPTIVLWNHASFEIALKAESVVD